jgi:hypothetical protein
MRQLILTIQILAITLAAQAPSGDGRWTETRANEWYRQQPWLVGANYVPANAINQLEMWQAETFDPKTIDKELGWAAGIGMNTMRVFLHDLLWQQDAEGFKKRLDGFLTIAGKHGIHFHNWVDSAHQSRACTTRAGSRLQARRRCRTRRNMPASRPTSKA